jgi:hypothetical protein
LHRGLSLAVQFIKWGIKGEIFVLVVIPKY